MRVYMLYPLKFVSTKNNYHLPRLHMPPSATVTDMFWLLWLVNFFSACEFLIEMSQNVHNVCSPNSWAILSLLALVSPASAPSFVFKSQSQSQSQKPNRCSALCQTESESSQFVSLSASWVWSWALGCHEVEQGGPVAGRASAHLVQSVLTLPLPLLLLLIYFDLFTIAIYICSFSFSALETSEKSAHSNKIKLGFIDPFQFDSL